MLPLTKVVPKELLPAGAKPMIHLAVEEAVASGVTQICIVIRKGKELIRDYFSAAPSSESKGSPLIEEWAKLTLSCELCFACQEKPRGLGDALHAARDFVGGESFVMIIPDQFMQSDVPATAQILGRWVPGPSVWSGLVRLSRDDAPFFVGARGYDIGPEIHPGLFLLHGIHTEKAMNSRWGAQETQIRGIGRTVFPPEIFNYLGARYVNPSSGEVDLLKTFRKCLRMATNYGVILSGEPVDLGTLPGYYRYVKRLWEESR
jgi:UTP--glucose-1-phosphate uridylyltransferase